MKYRGRWFHGAQRGTGGPTGIIAEFVIPPASEVIHPPDGCVLEKTRADPGLWRAGMDRPTTPDGHRPSIFFRNRCSYSNSPQPKLIKKRIYIFPSIPPAFIRDGSMEITVTKRVTGQHTEKLHLPEDSTITDLIDRAGLFVDITLAVRDERMVPCDAKLKDGDHVTLINVASGG